MQLATGHLVGDRYALTRRIAIGGMGEVWAAEDRLLGRPVAVKLPRQEVRAEAGFAERLLAEARHAASVHHPGIAGVYDVSADEPEPYLVMELVDGRPLSRVIAEQAPLEPERARRIVCQVARALDAAHAAGLVHRDVKPDNLLLTADDTVKVTDFGIARAVDTDSFTRTGFVHGTAQYLSPEQAGGQPASARSDLYALGIVAYELLTGRRPFDGDDPLSILRAHREQPVPPLPPHVPADLRALVLALLAKDPAKRPSAAHVLGTDRESAAATAVLRRPVLPSRSAAQPTAVHPVLDGEPGPHTAEHPVPEDGNGPGTAEHPTLDGAPEPRSAARSMPRHPAGPHAAARSMPGDERRRRRTPVVLAALAGLVVAAGLALALLDGDRRQDVPAPDPPAQAVPPQPVPVREVQLFHPGGSAGDDPEDVVYTVDGNPATAWTTQRYRTPAFGNLRPGVGLLLDTGEPSAVRQVRLALDSPGLDLRVHAGNTPGPELLATPALATAQAAPADTLLSLVEAVTARYWVVWIERLPPSPPHLAAVTEVSLLG